MPFYRGVGYRVFRATGHSVSMDQHGSRIYLVGSDEHPMRILPSTQYSWIDLGRGVPDL